MSKPIEPGCLAMVSSRPTWPQGDPNAGKVVRVISGPFYGGHRNGAIWRIDQSVVWKSGISRRAIPEKFLQRLDDFDFSDETEDTRELVEILR